MITVEKLEKGTYFDDAFKISFRYDPTTVAKVKELAERRYLPEDRAWEIPAYELPALIEKVKPLEIDDYHVYVNAGIKEIHEEAKDGDISSGFDGFEIETQEIYEKDEYIQLMAEKNSSLEEQTTDMQLALADVYEQVLGLTTN